MIKKYVYTLLKLNLIILFIVILINVLTLFSNSNNFLQSEKSFKRYLRFIQRPSSKLCHQTEKKFILAYIFGRVDSFDKRKAIRETWANKQKFPLLKAVFVTALSKTDEINKNLIEENLVYGDVIQGNFIDSYRNLSYKSLLAFKWISKNCNNAQYILKIDDDVVLNTNLLMDFLKNESSYFPTTNFQGLKNTFICRIVETEAPCRHNGCGKMFTTFEEYNKELYGLENYSPFCSGVAFLMTSDLAQRLLLKSNEIKLFWIDDVYVGILGRFANAKFLQLWNWFIEKKEKFKLKTRKDILFVRDADTVAEINSIWSEINP